MKSLNASAIASQTILLITRQNNIKIHGESQDLWTDHVNKIGQKNGLFCVTLKVATVYFS